MKGSSQQQQTYQLPSHWDVYHSHLSYNEQIPNKTKKTPLTQGHQSDWGKAYLPVPSLYYQHGSKSWNVWCQCKSSNEGDKWKVKQMQPMWLCIFLCTSFEETFENAHCWKVKKASI